jgi:hypothetical protein
VLVDTDRCYDRAEVRDGADFEIEELLLMRPGDRVEKLLWSGSRRQTRADQNIICGAR